MFPKNSAFNPDPLDRRGPVRELFRKTEAAIHEREHHGDVIVQHDRLEEWYATLDELARQLDVPGEHVVAAGRILAAGEAVERLRDEVYSYLRG